MTATENHATSLGDRDSWKITVGYGLAHFGKSLFWYAGELLFAFFLTEAAQLSGVEMAFVLGGSLMFSAVLDIIGGRLLAGALSSVRLTVRLQFVGAVMSACALILVLAGSQVPLDWRLTYLACAAIGFRLAYLFYDLPQNVLLVLATSNDKQRSNVTAVRLFFSGCATLAIAATVGRLVAAQQVGETDHLFLWIGFGLGTIAILTALWLVHLFNGWAEDEASRTADLLLTAHHKARGIVPHARFPPLFWLIMLFCFITSVTTPTFAKLEPYFATYVLQSPFWGSVLSIAFAVGVTASQPLWLWINGFFSRANVLRLSLIIVIIGALSFFLVIDIERNAATAAAFMVGAGVGGIGMICWAATADVIASTPGQEGVGITILTAINKIALAMNAIAIGIFLSMFNFRNESGSILLNGMVILPVIGSVFCLLFTLYWKKETAYQNNAKII